jgi:putative transposase
MGDAHPLLAALSGARHGALHRRVLLRGFTPVVNESCDGDVERRGAVPAGRDQAVEDGDGSHERSFVTSACDVSSVIVMRLRYAFRLYPDTGQRCALARAFGCARVVFNDAVRAREDARAAREPFPSAGQLSKELITRAKRTVERAWLGEVSAVVLQQSLRDVEAAYRNFFASLKGARRGASVGAPRFKSRKDNRQSIRFTANARWSITDKGRLNLPKIGAVRVKWSRSLPTTPASVTVIRDAAGRYFAHQLSTRLIRENQAIGVEDLAVKGLARTRLAKSVHDAGWSQFVGMLEYEAAGYGRALVRIDRFEPTSQVCSACGFRGGPKPLHVREWTCAACGAVHDRDHNAAKNVKTAAGLVDAACGAQVRPGSVLAQRGEAGSHGFSPEPRAA